MMRHLCTKESFAFECCYDCDHIMIILSKTVLSITTRGTRYVSSTNNSMLQLLSKWADNWPVFSLSANQIEIIYSPNQFFDTIQQLTETSKKRITLSSLYFGSGLMEDQLISGMIGAQNKQKELKLTLLLDYNRCTRVSDANGVKTSSKSTLLPLTQNGANVYFYLTPNMSGWKKYLVFGRQKWNELVSLHHIKCYIFDDNIIISGANLSESYFTNRQDRYILLRNVKHLSDYLDELIATISTFSMQLSPSGHLQLNPSFKYHPLNYFHRNKFRNEAKNRINKLNNKFRNNTNLMNCNTILFPLLQLKTIGISDDEYFTCKLLENSNESTFMKLASGYFNLTDRYKTIILNRKSRNTCHILMASERANGFYGANGAIAKIPLVYTRLTKLFLKQVNIKNSNISLCLYNRPNWTFHAKGLWLSLNSQYFLTLIGSPNFGYRSVYRDNELQFVLLTRDENLKNNLIAECDNLFKYSSQITNDSQLTAVPLWICLFTKLFKSYF